MGWKVSWQVVCEMCKLTGPSHTDSRLAEGRARDRGWVRGQVYGMAMHLCPDCAAKERPEWWPDESGMRFHWEDCTDGARND